MSGQVGNRAESAGSGWAAIVAASGSWVVAVCLLALVIGVQVASGAYNSERGLYSDEAAHFMNGLLIRDYLWTGMGSSPLAFAEEYYFHYPKIAPLMWPPLFHVILGVVLLPGWGPMTAAIGLLAPFTAWTGWRLYTIISTFASLPIAVSAVVFFVLSPSVVSLSGSVMVDIVIAALALEATYWLSRYVQSERLGDATLFGLFAAAGCLAKGNGVAIVLVPVMLLILTNRYRLLRAPGLYLAAGIVLVCATPMLAYSAKLDASIGDFSPVTLPMVTERLRYYSLHVLNEMGVVGVMLASLGAVASLSRRGALSKSASLQARGLMALVLAAFAFHLLSPHTLSHERYITLAFAPLFGLAASGVMVMCRPIRAHRWRWGVQTLVFFLLTLSNVILRPAAAQVPLGYRSVVRHLVQDGSLAGERMLVVSDEAGEGAGVTEVAVLGLEPKPVVLRGSKLLGSDDWMGRNFRANYSSPAELLADLEAMHVRYVILDTAAAARRLPYWRQVRDAMTLDSRRTEIKMNTPVDPTSGPARLLEVYQLTFRTAAPPKRPSVKPSSGPTARSN